MRKRHSEIFSFYNGLSLMVLAVIIRIWGGRAWPLPRDFVQLPMLLAHCLGVSGLVMASATIPESIWRTVRRANKVHLLAWLLVPILGIVGLVEMRMPYQSGYRFCTLAFLTISLVGAGCQMVSKPTLNKAREASLTLCALFVLAASLAWEIARSHLWAPDEYIRWWLIITDFAAITYGLSYIYRRHRWLYFRVSVFIVGSWLAAMRARAPFIGSIALKMLREFFGARPSRWFWYPPRWAFFGVFVGVAIVGAGQIFQYDTVFEREFQKDDAALHDQFQAIAAAIREVTPSPVEQVKLAEMVTYSFVEYENHRRIYHSQFYAPSLREVLRKQKENHWVYPRGDCKVCAMFCAHILSALDIPWQPQGDVFIRSHAWLSVTINGEQTTALYVKDFVPAETYGPNPIMRQWLNMKVLFWPYLKHPKMVTEVRGWPGYLPIFLNSLPKERRERITRCLGYRSEDQFINWTEFPSLDDWSPRETRQQPPKFPISDPLP